MNTATTALPATAGAARVGQAPAQRAFRTAKILVGTYGALGTAVLLTVVVLAATGHEVTSFMWGRSAGVLASAAVTYWLTVLAARGKRWAYLRVRIVSVVMPVVIVAIDLIPGALPVWFIAAQAVCALAIGATALVTNGSELRAAFAEGR
ncbi:hypothetical protein CP973_26880 [Streptomyces albofaciens JCM 4342]|uniref:hypothetical protein n=1 Tax=Streptomyces albofaciens TaxID=66866 RepID=UPI00123AFD5C|nr:hypothetical protein [Streptomyces albofaciens]KAA6212947.1 hypothetical protein CP973_26880 [Streptomyces albofaciens JCM 4342]